MDDCEHVYCIRCVLGQYTSMVRITRESFKVLHMNCAWDSCSPSEEYTFDWSILPRRIPSFQCKIPAPVGSTLVQQSRVCMVSVCTSEPLPEAIMDHAETCRRLVRCDTCDYVCTIGFWRHHECIVHEAFLCADEIGAV
jgi:uncharacterized metal-binding protein